MCPKLTLDIQAWKELPELVPGILVDAFFGGGADPYHWTLGLLAGCLEKAPKKSPEWWCKMVMNPMVEFVKNHQVNTLKHIQGV